VKDYVHKFYIKDRINNRKISVHRKIKSERKLTFKFSGFNLPCTIDSSEWGTITYLSYNNLIVKKPNSKLVYQIELFDNYQLVKLLNHSNQLILLGSGSIPNKSFPTSKAIDENIKT
jgi:hypothetical protein